MMNTAGKSCKWVTLALLSGAFFFHQADRALFGLLTIPIQEDLHLTDLQIGWVNTALFCTLALTTPFAGVLGDRFSRKWIITFSLLVGSLSPLMLGALSQKYGVHGFEIGFAILGCTYVAGALALFVSYGMFFAKHKVME